LRRFLLGAVSLAFVTAAINASSAAEYYVAQIEVPVLVWAGKIWDYFRYFCNPPGLAIGRSSCVAGNAGPGSIRVLDDGSKELLVAVGEYFYTYEVIGGPFAGLDYHVTLRAVPTEDPFRSTMTATLIWDEEPLPENERLVAQYRYTAAMHSQLWDAKILAEAS
jgi:hypothetical protein